MNVIYAACAGLDVHKKSVTACIWITPAQGEATKQTRSFGTMTEDLLALRDWLQSQCVTHVAMESTGVYWKPVYNVLEGGFELLVVNAQHIKTVPGRKTDVSDAEWISDLLRHGLLRGSFVPPQPQRELRELTRHRSNLVGKRAQATNELQKILESTNIKLASVVSDITGVSAVAMLQALLAGQTDRQALAELAKGRLRSKKELLQKALEGVLRAHHRLILGQLLADLEFFDEQIVEVGVEIARRLEEHRQELQRLDDIPGVNERIGEIILAEVGTDMSRFPSEHHLTSWAGLCPGNNESAGKRRRSRVRPGNKALKNALVEAAHAAGHTRGTYLQAQYKRLASKRGKKRAKIAVARSILIGIYHMFKRAVPWRELGASYFDQRNPLKVIQRITKRLQSLGYHVDLTPLPSAA